MSQRRMSQRRAVTQTIATRYRRAQGREGQDPRRAVRHDGLAPQPRPQGTRGGPPAADRGAAPAATATAHLRAGGGGWAAVLLGGAGCAHR